MTKWAVAVAAGTGLTAVSLGGYYLAKSVGKAKSNADASDSKGRTVLQEVDDAVLKRDTGFGAECASTFMESLKSSSQDQSMPKFTGGDADLKNFLDNASADSQPKSCVSIDHQTVSESGGNRWFGHISWIWFYVRGDKGFVSSMLVKTGDGDRLMVQGTLFLIQKESGAWKYKYERKQSEESIYITKDNLEEYFPTVNSSLLGENVQKYWGFIREPEDLDRVCSENACASAKSSPSQNKTLAWKRGGSSHPHQWCESLVWWQKLYGLNLNLMPHFKQYMGSWVANFQEFSVKKDDGSGKKMPQRISDDQDLGLVVG